jgi:hypothetical protein
LSLNKREHDIWYPILINRDREICQVCHKTPRATKPEYFVRRLIIHEKEYKRPIEAELLCLLCDRCNQLIHPQKQERFKREMPPELAVNREKEPRARQYIVNRILMDGSTNIRKLIASTAEKVGCSTKAADSYLDKLVSDEGILTDIMGDIFLKGYEPEIKFDIMANVWVTTRPAKEIPPEIIKEIQAKMLVR